MAEFIPEFEKIIKTGDIEGARDTLIKILSLNETDQQAVIERLALSPDDTAYDILSFLMNTMGPAHPLQPRLYQLAMDRAHINFKFALILLNHTDPDRPGPIAPLIRHILGKETHRDLIEDIFRAAGRLGTEFLIDDLAEFVFYGDPELRKAAVTALERIGTDKAVQRLEQIAQTDKCGQDILDSLAFLQGKKKTQPVPKAPKAPPKPRPAAKPKAAPAPKAKPETKPRPSLADMTPLEANTWRLASPSMEERFQALAYFRTRGDEVASALHDNLDNDEPDLLVNLLRLTACTIPHDSIGDLLTLAEQTNLDNLVRFSLYTALSHYPEFESTAPIVKAATDPVIYVGMGAIKALDRHCSDYIVAEIKKRIESGTKSGEALATTILDAGATHLIEALMTSDTFTYICSNYLHNSAPVSVIDTWIRLLEKRNRTATAKKFIRLKEERDKEHRPVIVVIHPSTTFLDVNARLIHNCGSTARTFTSPQEAFEFISEKKPAAIITDFVVEQMTVMTLAQEIRELYSAQEVPIIVSSLQRHMDRIQLSALFEKSGINGFWEFPAKPSQIKSLLTAK